MESGPLIRFSDVLTKRNGDVLFYFNTYIVQRLLKHDQLTGHLGFRWKPGAFLQIGVAATASGGGCTSFFFHCLAASTLKQVWIQIHVSIIISKQKDPTYPKRHIKQAPQVLQRKPEKRITKHSLLLRRSDDPAAGWASTCDASAASQVRSRNSTRGA